MSSCGLRWSCVALRLCLRYFGNGRGQLEIDGEGQAANPAEAGLGHREIPYSKQKEGIPRCRL